MTRWGGAGGARTHSLTHSLTRRCRGGLFCVFALALPPACSLEEHCLDDNAKLSAPEIHSYLTRVLYKRRNKMDPLWNTMLVAGFKEGQRRVGAVRRAGAGRPGPGLSESGGRAPSHSGGAPTLCHACPPPPLDVQLPGLR